MNALQLEKLVNFLLCLYSANLRMGVPSILVFKGIFLHISVSLIVYLDGAEFWLLSDH